MNRLLTLTLWKLRRVQSEELPQIATCWLADGLDAPSLRELAGIDSPVMSEVGPLFEKALAELGFSLPDEEDALMFLARHYAQQIVDRTISPYEGASKIWWQVANSFDSPDRLLLGFVGAASELEDLPERTLQDRHERTEYAAELEEMIFACARELLKEEPNQTQRPARVGDRNSA